MRLKTFTAPTMAEAMDLVREQLGADAIIVASQTGGGGGDCRITAAIEEADPASLPEPPDNDTAVQTPVDAGDTGTGETAALMRQVLVRHGTPPRLVERLASSAAVPSAAGPAAAFAQALAEYFAFEPLGTPAAGARLMLVGPPGAGKTITTAKLAARARLAKTPCAVITTDTRRAGGVEQLQAFTNILELDLKVAEDAAALGQTLASLNADSVVYIDSGGANPFSRGDMEHLKALIAAADADPVLVLPAGGDALESADIAAAFAAVGCRRLLVTRLDMARRLGSLLAAADAGRLAFSDVSINAQVADGLSPLGALSLARLMMPDAALATVGADDRSTADPDPSPPIEATS